MWLIFRFIANSFFASSAVIDDFIVDKFKTRWSMLTLVVFSTVFALIPTSFLFIISGVQVFNLQISAILLLLLAGAGEFFSLYFYMNSLKYGEAAISAAFYRLQPVAVLFVAVFFMGEIISNQQLFGALMIIFATFLFSLKLNTLKQIKVGNQQTAFMLPAVACSVIETLLIQAISNHTGITYLVLGFWQFFSIFLCGVFLLIFSKSTRAQTKTILFDKYPKKKTFFIAEILNETLYLGAILLGYFSNTLGSVAISSTLSGLQPMLVFLIGFILFLWKPKVFKGDYQGIALAQKIVGSLLIIGGSFLIV